MKRLAFLPLVALLAAGCFGGANKTKAGSESLRQLTFVMQTPDAPDPNAEYFIQQVKQRTNGRIHIVEGGTDYGSCNPEHEAGLVAALRAGRAQMAYIPSRAWERGTSVSAFRALQAPFLIGDYRTLHRVASGRIGASMLRSLGQIGVVGLGLVPDELRRALGRRPLVSPKALDGARIRVVTSPTSVIALRALDARPLTDFTCHEVGPALASGRLDGVETSTKSIADNDYVHVAQYVAGNLALFAKTQTIAIRRAAFERLSARDRTALRAAAAAAVAHADPAAQERHEVQQLCRQGLRVVPVTPRSLAALRRQAAAAVVELRRDATTRTFINEITRLRTSGSAPLSACTGAAPAHANATPSGSFPQGRFMSNITRADFEKAGAGYQEPFPRPFVLTFDHGRWHTNEEPPFSGTYSVRGDEVTFVIARPRDNAGQRERVRWSYYRGRLTFQIVDVHDPGSRVIYTAHPFRRIGAAAPEFPTGTFETQITAADLRGTPFPAEDAHWERLTFRADGTWRDEWFHPRRADQPVGEGRYTVEGNVVTLMPANPDVLKWSYYRGFLTFRIVSDPDVFGSFTYTVHPWRKIR